MFTGIVEAKAQIYSVAWQKEFQKYIAGQIVLEQFPFDVRQIALGESIAVQGVCLTASRIEVESGGLIYFDLGPETLARTTLSTLTQGQKVNVERSLLPTTRMGGHFVSGHVDGIGRVLQVSERGNAFDFEINAPQDLMRYIVPRGSITVDGISLTITGKSKQSFMLSLIPHTLVVTTAEFWSPGVDVNLEVDLIARYLESLGNPLWDRY